MSSEHLKQTKSESHIKHEDMVYANGALEYLDINHETADPSHNKLVVGPGFTQGIEVLEDFGKALGDEGGREVFVLDQLERNKKTLERPKPFSRTNREGIEQQAEALITFLEHQGLTQEPVDFVTNSLYAMVVARAAEMVRDRGWKSFKSSEGSNTFFISPAGLKENENIFTLGTRFGKSAIKNQALGKILDPTGEMLAAACRTQRKIYLRHLTKLGLYLKCGSALKNWRKPA